MQQLDFWPAPKKTPYEQGHWEALSFEDRANLQAMLARLIAKVICPKLIGDTEEKTHEQ